MRKPETRTYIELLKRRVASLRLMAKELIVCRQSLVSMDVESAREHIFNGFYALRQWQRGG